MTVSVQPSSPNSAEYGRLFVISGPSGTGKSTIVARVRERVPLAFSVSATTRRPRPGEVDGVHYRFVDDDTFDAMIEEGELLEWATYGTRRYGTPRAPVMERLAAGDDVLLEIEVQGARQIRHTHPEAVMVFVVPPGRAALEDRLRARGDTDEDDIRRRLRIALEEMEAAPRLFDHLVVNDDLDTAVAEVVGLLGT